MYGLNVVYLVYTMPTAAALSAKRRRDTWRALWSFEMKLKVTQLSTRQQIRDVMMIARSGIVVVCFIYPFSYVYATIWR